MAKHRTWPAIGCGVLALLCARAQGQAGITLLDCTAGDDSLTAKIREACGEPDFLTAPPVVFERLTGYSGSYALMLANTISGERPDVANGHLIAIMAPLERIGPQSILTLRLVLPEGGTREDAALAFDTLAEEGDKLERVGKPNEDWLTELTPVPGVPPQLAEKMCTVGSAKVAAVSSPRGLHVAFARQDGGERRAYALLLPTAQALEEHALDWGGGG